MASADYNGEGVVDLYSEYTFAHSYYASSYDKGGKTNYLATVNQAFIDVSKEQSPSIVSIVSEKTEKIQDMFFFNPFEDFGFDENT